MSVQEIQEDQQTRDLILGWAEKLFVRINSLFPFLVDGAIAKQLSTILAFARRARSII